MVILCHFTITYPLFRMCLRLMLKYVLQKYNFFKRRNLEIEHENISDVMQGKGTYNMFDQANLFTLSKMLYPPKL